MKNPMRAVSPPNKRQREAKFYTPEQLGVLLAKAVGTRLELPMYICAYLGLRRGELCGLRWSDVDLEHQTITIENTRTQAGKKEIEKGTKTASSTRTLYLPDTLCDMLKAAKEHQQACRATYKNAYDDNDYVVVMEDGRPFRPNYLSELFGKFLADNDLPKIVLHEPLSEFLACQLAEQVCPAAVRYDLDFYYHKLISKCRLFTDEAHGLVKLLFVKLLRTAVKGDELRHANFISHQRAHIGHIVFKGRRIHRHKALVNLPILRQSLLQYRKHPHAVILQHYPLHAVLLLKRFQLFPGQFLRGLQDLDRDIFTAAHKFGRFIFFHTLFAKQ